MDQARMTKILEHSKQEYSKIALAKARQVYGSQTCTAGSCDSYRSNKAVQSSSQALQAAMNACPVFVRAPPTSERVRLSNLQQGIVDAEPSLEFNRFFPPACPAIDPVILNAFLPKASTACPLPNTVLNPARPV